MKYFVSISLLSLSLSAEPPPIVQAIKNGHLGLLHREIYTGADLNQTWNTLTLLQFAQQCLNETKNKQNARRIIVDYINHTLGNFTHES